MKKILALVLTLCLLCGGVAMAENTNTTINQDSAQKTGTTTVSYTIKANESYTVTIPSKVELKGASDPEPSELMGTMTISLDATSFNVANKKISVTLTGKGSVLKLKGDESKQIMYGIAKDGSAINENSVCLEWESFSTSSTASTELTMLSADGRGIINQTKKQDALRDCNASCFVSIMNRLCETICMLTKDCVDNIPSAH